MRYRVKIEAELTSRKPDARSSTPSFFVRKTWETFLAVEGDANTVAAALRALLSKIDKERDQ